MEVIFASDLSTDQGCVSYFNISNGVQLKTFKGSICAQNGYGLIGNDLLLTAQHNKQLIHVYDTHKEQLCKKIVCPGKVSCLAVSPCSHYCIVALVEKIYIWQIATGNLINILSSHYQNINKISFTNDGAYFVTCGDDSLVHIWNFISSLQPVDHLNPDNKDDQPFHSLSNHSMPVKDLFISVTGTRSRLVTASLDQTCKMFDIPSAHLICSFIFDTACLSVVMDTAETRMFVGSTNGSIYFINCFQQTKSTDAHISQDKSSYIQAHSKSVNCLSVSMDGSILLSGSLDCMVKLWHIESRQCLRTFSFKGEVTNACIRNYPVFLQKDYTPPKVKLQLKNFKRAIYVASEHLDELDFDSMETDDNTLIPVVLKDITTTNFPGDGNDQGHLSNYELAKIELMTSSSENSDSLENATRAELIQKVKSLENMAKEFHKLASNNLLNDFEKFSEVDDDCNKT